MHKRTKGWILSRLKKLNNLKEEYIYNANKAFVSDKKINASVHQMIKTI